MSKAVRDVTWWPALLWEAVLAAVCVAAYWSTVYLTVEDSIIIGVGVVGLLAVVIGAVAIARAYRLRWREAFQLAAWTVLVTGALGGWGRSFS